MIEISRAKEVERASRHTAPKGKVPQFFRCGCCECYHSTAFYGDCRDDANRFCSDEIDEALGAYGWEEVDQPE